MANMKKLLSIILSWAVCMALFTGVVSAESSTVDIDEMAAALNRLNILQGDNGSYLLYDNLERAQATALIIRMLGKENYVKENADELRPTKYPDVPEGSWYAPYVGYSTIHNIVAGDLEGNFTPLKDTTEKAFLKMALCALDYEYNVDFDWTNVYQKAYEVGVVTDLSYSTRTEDDNDYLRSQAIEVLYKALNTCKKGTETKMVLSLVKDGVFTSEEVAASDILSDDKKTGIDSVEATAPNIVEVMFNENILDVKKDDISIYAESDDEDNALEVRSIDFGENSIKIVTAIQTPEESYIIDIKSVEDTEGNMSDKVSATFEGYESREIRSDYFKVGRVEQISGNILHVYFTHPVNTNSETPIYYELLENGSLLLTGSTQNMMVKKLQAEDNAVSIYIDNISFKEGEVYTLRVSGKLTSSYGVRLGEGEGEAYDFIVTETERDQLEVSSVKAWTNNSVRIVFNHEIDTVWAEKKLNYTVYDDEMDEIEVTNAVVSSSGSYSGREVLLSLSKSLDRDEYYELKIEYIPDLYKRSEIENEMMEFSGKYSADKKLALSEAESLNSNSVLLTFNKALDPIDALDIKNYLVKGVNLTSYNVEPIKVYYSEQGEKYTVKLFLPSKKPLSSAKRYTAYAYRLMDALGNTETGTLQSNFTGGKDDSKQWISDAVTISKDAVKVTFTTEMAFNPTNLSVSNYALEYEENGGIYRMVPMGVTYVDETTLVLRFDELDEDNTYRLRFNSLIDYSEEYVLKDSDITEPVEVEWGE